MATKDVSVVLAHGAWADGSSWARVIATLKADGVNVSAAPLPIQSICVSTGVAMELRKSRPSESAMNIAGGKAPGDLCCTMGPFQGRKRIQSHNQPHNQSSPN